MNNPINDNIDIKKLLTNILQENDINKKNENIGIMSDILRPQIKKCTYCNKHDLKFRMTKCAKCKELYCNSHDLNKCDGCERFFCHRCIINCVYCEVQVCNINPSHFDSRSDWYHECSILECDDCYQKICLKCTKNIYATHKECNKKINCINCNTVVCEIDSHACEGIKCNQRMCYDCNENYVYCNKCNKQFVLIS